MWITKSEEVKEPDVKQVYRVGPVTLFITDDKDQRWKYFTLSFGEFTTDNVEDCEALWPREALAQARKALDEFEATL